MTYGAIYIAHNSRDGDTTFKVGKTSRIVEERMKELTAAPSNLGRYTVRAYFVVFDIDAAELACHRALQRYRVQDNREFFEIPFSRLIRILDEQTRPYVAGNLVPEQEEQEPSPKQLSPTELIKSARERRTYLDQSWDQALASGLETISEWEKLVLDKALQVQNELQGERTLRWSISSTGRSDSPPNSPVPICSVTVVSLFSKEPPILPGDDGRIGRIELVTSVEHAMPDDRERGIRPLPRIEVCAVRLAYDNYYGHIKNTDRHATSYNDPAEAFEVFLELVVENAKVAQYDVRQRDRHIGILDRGKIEMGGLTRV